MGDAPATARLSIKDILRDPQRWVRRKLDLTTVKRYARAAAEDVALPPVLVALVDGVPVLADGWHRIAALEQRGVREVEARCVPAAAHEVQWLGAQANLAHGLPLKPREVRVAFGAFIEARQHLKPAGRAGQPRALLSYREIARALGTVGHTTIRAWMRKDHPDIFRRMGGANGPVSNEPPGGGMTSQGALHDTARQSLQALRVAARGVLDPHLRGLIRMELQEVLREIEGGGTWVMPDF